MSAVGVCRRSRGCYEFLETPNAGVVPVSSSKPRVRALTSGGQVAESLKRFGINDDTSAVLVARFDCKPEEVSPGGVTH